MKLLPLLSRHAKSSILSAQAASGCVVSYVKQFVQKKSWGEREDFAPLDRSVANSCNWPKAVVRPFLKSPNFMCGTLHEKSAVLPLLASPSPPPSSRSPAPPPHRHQTPTPCPCGALTKLLGLPNRRMSELGTRGAAATPSNTMPLALTRLLPNSL